MSFSRLWPHHRPSIYRFIRERIPAGLDDCSLPDEEEFNKDSKIRWAAGALDGVFGHHGGEREEEHAATILATLREVIRGPTSENIGRLYDMLIEDRTIDFIDPFLSLLAEDRIAAAPELPVLARWLATEAPDRDAVKFGLALLGQCGDIRDADVFMTLGRHEEFSLYAAVALSETLPDPEPALWELAQHVHGWGRIHLVERLGSTTNEAIKRWMLRDGYKNSVMYEYLAFRCATTGGLLAALQDPAPDEELLAGAGEIIEALLRGGPAEDMDDYADGAEAVHLYLKQVARRPSNDITQFAIIEAIKTYVDDASTDWSTSAKQHWTENVRREVSLMAGAILGRIEWREIALEGLLSDDISTFRTSASTLEALGIDVWEVRFDRQRAGVSDEWYWLMMTDVPARVERVVALAEGQLDLHEIASGPADELGLGAEFRQHAALDWLLQELHRFPGKGWKLVVAAFKSPVVRNRNFAVRVLAAWGKDMWLSEMPALLEQAVADEPDAPLRQRMQNLLDGRPLNEGVLREGETIH